MTPVESVKSITNYDTEELDPLTDWVQEAFEKPFSQVFEECKSQIDITNPESFEECVRKMDAYVNEKGRLVVKELFTDKLWSHIK